MKVINGQTGLIEHDLLTLEEMNNAPYPYYDENIYNKYFDGNPIPMNQLLLKLMYLQVEDVHLNVYFVFGQQQ